MRRRIQSSQIGSRVSVSVSVLGSVLVWSGLLSSQQHVTPPPPCPDCRMIGHLSYLIPNVKEHPAIASRPNVLICRLRASNQLLFPSPSINLNLVSHHPHRYNNQGHQTSRLLCTIYNTTDLVICDTDESIQQSCCLWAQLIYFIPRP